MRGVRVYAFLAGAMLFTGPVQARPAMALNVNFLDINENECEQRAQSAFSAAGWTDITYKGNTWVRAHKGDFSSYIACNASASGGVAVNIFVAYDGNDPEGNIVGAERDQLKAQMQKPQ